MRKWGWVVLAAATVALTCPVAARATGDRASGRSTPVPPQHILSEHRVETRGAPREGAAGAAAVVPATVTAAAGGARSEPVYTKRIVEEYRIDTPHGSMYGSVVRPVVPAGVKVPVILSITPYGVLQDAIWALQDETTEFFVPRGYARAFFDVLGTHSSGGCFDLGGAAEREASAIVVDHLGSRPWSNGRVGMMGFSYEGTNQIGTAIAQPKHLAAIIPSAAGTNWYEAPYWGGVHSSTPAPLPPVYHTPMSLIPPLPLDGKAGAIDPAAYAEHIRPCNRVEIERRMNQTDPVFDEWWADRNYRLMADRVKVPVLIEHGWLDSVNAKNALRFFDALPDTAIKHLSIGNWGHGYAQFEDSADLRHAWFDQFLLGLDTGVLDRPPVDITSYNGPRRALSSWPPTGTVQTTVPLVSDGKANSSRVTMRLLGGGEPSFTDINHATTYTEAAMGPSLTRSYLVYESDPLPRDIHISGVVVLDLNMKSSLQETHLCVLASHKAPDGTLTDFSGGMLNTRNRNGLDKSESVVPGKPFRAPVEGYEIDYVIRKGHRLRLMVASGCPLAQPENAGIATNTILDGSVLRLPVTAGADVLGQ